MRYKLSPSVECALVGGDKAVFKSSVSRLELEGDSITDFIDRVVPLLNGKLNVEEIAEQLNDISLPSLSSHLRQLADAGVLQVVNTNDVGEKKFNSPLIDLLTLYGHEDKRLRKRLLNTKIAIVGLESAGFDIALQLARAEIGALQLYDPCLSRSDDPWIVQGELGIPRDTAANNLLMSFGHSCTTINSDTSDWSKEKLTELVGSVDLVVVALDRDHRRVAHWVNDSAVENNKLAVYVTVDGAKAVVGPLVIPDRSACYMCYRMRYLATRSSFEEEMAFELMRDSRIGSSNCRAPSLPVAASVASGLLVSEIIKFFTNVGSVSLIDGVSCWDSLASKFDNDPVLAQPNCPTCSKKKLKYIRKSDLSSNNELIKPLIESISSISNSRTGVVCGTCQPHMDSLVSS